MIYENAADKEREEGVANAISYAWNCEQIKRPELDGIDCELQRDGDTVAYVEIKCRNNPSHQYDEYMIDAFKLSHGLWVSDHEGRPFFLVVKFTDGIHWVRVTEEIRRNQRPGGRVDRGDPNDIEMCCYIPMKLFRKLKEVSWHHSESKSSCTTRPMPMTTPAT